MGFIYLFVQIKGIFEFLLVDLIRRYLLGFQVLSHFLVYCLVYVKVFSVFLYLSRTEVLIILILVDEESSLDEIMEI